MYGKRVDDGDLCLAVAQPLLELPGGVETGVAAADDQDFGHSERSPQHESMPLIYSLRRARLKCRHAPTAAEGGESDETGDQAERKPEES